MTLRKRCGELTAAGGRCRNVGRCPVDHRAAVGPVVSGTAAAPAGPAPNPVAAGVSGPTDGGTREGGSGRGGARVRGPVRRWRLRRERRRLEVTRKATLMVVADRLKQDRLSDSDRRWFRERLAGIEARQAAIDAELAPAER